MFTEFTDIRNPYLDEYGVVKATYDKAMGSYRGGTEIIDFYGAKCALTNKYSWAVPSGEAIALIADLRLPIIEVGAGTGYWGYLLDQMDVDIDCYDVAPYKNDYVNGKWYPVHKGTPADLLYLVGNTHRTLMMCWPPGDEDEASLHYLDHYKGDTFIFIGEISPATGSDGFHALLKREWDIHKELVLPRWTIARDSLFIYRRKGSKA